MKKVIILTYIIFILIGLQIKLFACTCLENNTPICAQLARADSVFVGKVEKIEPVTNSDKETIGLSGVGSISSAGDSYLAWAYINVQQNFKNMPGKTTRVLITQNTSCDLSMKKSERWIFYANRNEQGNLSVGPCSGTSRISRSDKAYLENVAEIAGDENPEAITGFIPKEEYSNEGLTKTIVTVSNNNFFASYLTSTTGLFNIRVPQPGKYNVQVTVPYSAVVGLIPFSLESSQVKMFDPTETASIFAYEAEVLPKQCQYSEMFFYPVDLKATAEVSGKFIASDGKQFPKFYPQLCRLKETEKETLDNCRMDTKFASDGTFLFSRLREGRYVIAVNLNDFPEVSEPFARQYYPGVKNFKDAQIVEINQGQKLENLLFNLLPQLPTQEIRGHLYWDDKTPLTYDPDNSSYSKPVVRLYNLRRPISPLKDEYYKFWNEERHEYEKVDTARVDPDGKFTITAFSGYEYILSAQSFDETRKSPCGIIKITANGNLKPIKLILNRTKKCWVDDYVKKEFKIN